MHIRLRRKQTNIYRCIALIGLLAMGACADDRRAEKTVAEVGDPDRGNDPFMGSDPDEAWKAMIGFDMQDTDSPSTPNEFSSFISRVEVWKQNWRVEGQVFWKQYPDDARRYDWLILAAHLAPSYPVSMEEWSIEEGTPGENCAPLEPAAHDAWQTTYPDLREAFWNSEYVTSQQRRFLWLGEIIQYLESMERVSACGGAVELKSVAEEIVSFASTFSLPLNVQDDGEFAWGLSGIVSRVLALQASSASTEVDIEALLNRLKLVGPDIAEVVANTLASRERSDERDSIRRQQPSYEPNAEVWHHLPWQFSGQPTSMAARVVFFHDRELLLRKLRSSGLYLWQHAPLNPHGRIYWLMRAVFPEPYYAKRFGTAVFAMANGNHHQFEIDQRSREDWDIRYPELRAAVWAAPEVSDAERATLRVAEVRQLAASVRSDVARYGVSKRSVDLLTGIGELQAPSGDQGLPHIIARRLMANIVYDYQSFGLSKQEVSAFLQPFSEQTDSPLKDIATGWFETQRVSTDGEAIEFAAPTLAGDSFDVSDLRGYIVLMDFWTTTCSACIAAMPRIHEIYLEYQDRGFEVVSVNFDAERNRRMVDRIDQELGLTWPTLNAESQWPEANQRFGWGNILPQYMLLDRDGLLVADTKAIDYGRNLRSLLEEMLATEAAEKGGSTIH